MAKPAPFQKKLPMSSAMRPGGAGTVAPPKPAGGPPAGIGKGKNPFAGAAPGGDLGGAPPAINRGPAKMPSMPKGPTMAASPKMPSFPKGPKEPTMPSMPKGKFK